MNPKYAHTQRTWVISFFFLVILGVIVAGGVTLEQKTGLPRKAVDWPGVLVLGLVFVVILFCLITFRSLSVEVNEEAVRLWFGPGVIRKSFPISDIETCRTVRNSPLVGWGIRWFPGCWVFNIYGLDAVELQMKGGRKYRIGTDQPKELAAAIEAALREQG
jgi:hypothetical protein